MKRDKGVIPFPTPEGLALPDELLPSHLIPSRPVNTPHQNALRRKLAQRQPRRLFYLGPIYEDWAVACHRAHPAAYLLACAIRVRFTLGEGEPVLVSQTLGDRLGINRDARKRALAALEATGLVRVERRPGCAPRASVLPWVPPKAR
jgi:hypothetical protein